MPALRHAAAAAVHAQPELALVAVGLLAVVVLVVYKAVLQPYSAVRFYRRQGIPGLKFRPLIGNLPEIREFSKTPYGSKLQKMFGAVHYHMFGPSIRVSLDDPELAKQVLVTKASHFVKPDFMRKALGPLLGESLLLVDGMQHHRQRKMISPAFHFANLKAMMGGMVDSTATAMREWLDRSEVARGAAAASPPEIDMHREISALTLKIVTRGVFGTNLPAGASADDVYDNLSAVLESFMSNLLSGVMFIPGFKHLPTKANKRGQASVKELNRTLAHLIRARREKMLTVAHGDAPATDLLAMLMAAKDAGNNGMDDEALRSEAMTFVLAGHETTAQLMSWTLVMLARHPEWVTKLREEVDSVLGNRDPTYPDLANMPLISAVLLETLRYLPPAANVGRKCIQDVMIGKYHIRKGTNIRISPYSIHHNPEVWDRPDEWLPERFKNGRRSAMKHQLAFLPFSAGKANCVGQNFAMLEAKTMLAMMVSKLDFVLSPSYVHHPSFQITLRPKYGLPMTVRRREPAATSEAASETGAGAGAETGAGAGTGAGATQSVGLAAATETVPVCEAAATGDSSSPHGSAAPSTAAAVAANVSREASSSGSIHQV